MVTEILYGLEKKNELVLKAQEITEESRIEWDAQYSDIAAGFLGIKQKMTGNSKITYYADRSAESGHADSAWAIMHALINEGLKTPDQDTREASVTFSNDAA